MFRKGKIEVNKRKVNIIELSPKRTNIKKSPTLLPAVIFPKLLFNRMVCSYKNNRLIILGIIVKIESKSDSTDNGELLKL